MISSGGSSRSSIVANSSRSISGSRCCGSSSSVCISPYCACDSCFTCLGCVSAYPYKQSEVGFLS